MDPINKKALRERLAALNSEEVKLACETLVWIDPERYIKELGRYVMIQKMDMEHIEFGINHRKSFKDKVTGKVMESEPIIFADKVDEKEGLQPEILSEKEIISTFDAAKETLEPINDIVNPVNLKVPEFFK